MPPPLFYDCKTIKNGFLDKYGLSKTNWKYYIRDDYSGKGLIFHNSPTA